MKVTAHATPDTVTTRDGERIRAWACVPGRRYDDESGRLWFISAGHGVRLTFDEAEAVARVLLAQVEAGRATIAARTAARTAA